MFVPAAVLVLAGLFLALVPNLKPTAAAAATRFINTDAYIAHVLDSRNIQSPPPMAHVPADLSSGLFAVFAALFIAAVHLFSPRGRAATAFFAKPFDVLHRIHSGHVADYVTFLTFGMACFGLLCIYCFR